MEPTQLQKIKGILPLEVTAAFLAIQTIFNGQLIPGTTIFEGANRNLHWMFTVLIILAIGNVILLVKSGEKQPFLILFSTLGFLIWAINIDLDRWQDWISRTFGAAPEAFGTNLLFPVLAVLYSFAAAVIATKPTSNPTS